MHSDHQECGASGDHPDVSAVLKAIYNKTQELCFQNRRIETSHACSAL